MLKVSQKGAQIMRVATSKLLDNIVHLDTNYFPIGNFFALGDDVTSISKEKLQEFFQIPLKLEQMNYEAVL
jgi:hypothetical protein